MATELNKVNALKVMGQYRKIIDIQKGGEHGRTGKLKKKTKKNPI